MNTEKVKESLKKRYRLVAAVIIIAGAVSMIAAFLLFNGGEKSVKFETVKENELPQDISGNVIPEYRSLERALACKVDDDVYVVVTRGEKPSSGFEVSVDRIMIEEDEGRTTLIVYALFEDPKKETAISQIITYPVEVVKTELDRLPDTIELRIQY